MTDRAAQGRIVVLDDEHGQWPLSPAFDVLARRLTIEVVTERLERARLVERLHRANVVVALRERTHFDRRLLDELSSVELIAQTGSGVAHIDLAAATEVGIAVAVMKGSEGGSIGTAELTIALALALLRDVPGYDRLMKEGGWAVPFGRVLNGSTVGLVGLGKVGARVAHIATAFEARVLAWTPSLDTARAERVGAEAVALERLFSESDVVSIHVPLRAETRGMIGPDLIGRMKPTAALVNTARGAVIDEAALVAALAERRIAGAGLDVFEVEPLPADHALRTLPNVVLTPHAGWPTDHAYRSFAGATATLIDHHLRGDPRYLLNPEALDRRPGGTALFGAWRT